MATKSVPEIDAVQKIHGILLPLTPESRGRVLRAATALLDTQYPDSNAEPSSIEQSLSKQHLLISGRSMKDFIVEKKPNTLSQRLACLAYFLEHNRNLSDITSKDLTQANAEARQPSVGDMGRELSTATRREGFFSDAGNHKKRLTPRGSAVVEALPDQEVVKKVLSEHIFKRKIAGRAKKKH